MHCKYPPLLYRNKIQVLLTKFLKICQNRPLFIYRTYFLSLTTKILVNSQIIYKQLDNPLLLYCDIFLRIIPLILKFFFYFFIRTFFGSKLRFLYKFFKKYRLQQQYHAFEKWHKKIPLSDELSVQTREVFSCMKLMWKSRIQYHFCITRLSESLKTLDI